MKLLPSQRRARLVQFMVDNRARGNAAHSGFEYHGPDTWTSAELWERVRDTLYLKGDNQGQYVWTLDSDLKWLEREQIIKGEHRGRGNPTLYRLS